MKNRFTTELPRLDEAAAVPAMLAELTDAELLVVSGGINPQPLPPRLELHEF
jgi:hypothetical protein